MDLSVVVLSWNTAASTLRTLQGALRGTPGLEAEVLCVDNGSTDGTAARIEAERPEVRLIRNEGNLGFAAGNNRALPFLRGRVVCFLNSDARPGPSTLPALVRRLDEDAGIGIVAPRLVGPDGREQRAARPEATPLALLHRFTALRWTPLGRREAKTWSRGIGGEVPVDVASVIGACLLIRGDLLRRLGGFDEGYPFYFEDADLCRRARAAGYRVRYDPTGEPVEHEGGAATARRGGPPRLEMLTGALRYACGALSPRQGRAYAGLFVPLALLRAMIEPARLGLRGKGREASAWLRFLERDAARFLLLLRRPG